MTNYKFKVSLILAAKSSVASALSENKFKRFARSNAAKPSTSFTRTKKPSSSTYHIKKSWQVCCSAFVPMTVYNNVEEIKFYFYLSLFLRGAKCLISVSGTSVLHTL